jgi:hypothetical protein
VTQVAELRFLPRQTASGYGYVCCGGEDAGVIAVIDVNSTQSGAAADVDEQLPVELEVRDSPRKPTVDIEHVGTNIINSVNIYKLKGNPESNIQDDVVAVLTNNDKTIRILSLIERVETAVLDMAFAVNHATISPDGQTLVGVGDYQQAFFFERINLDPSESRISTAKHASSHCRWVLLNIVQLHVPKPAAISGYFSTAWSHSGDLCAVASENGYITVLDTKLIKAECLGEDAVITIVSSTRPHAEPGAGSVRSLQFSPDPWDLLIWAEGRGRVCVADMRYTLDSRQVLHLDPEEPNLSRIKIEQSKGAVLSVSEERAEHEGHEGLQHIRAFRELQRRPHVHQQRPPNINELRDQFTRMVRDRDSASDQLDSEPNLHRYASEERVIADMLSSAAGVRLDEPRHSNRTQTSQQPRRNALDLVTRGNSRIEAVGTEDFTNLMALLEPQEYELLTRRQVSMIISASENGGTGSGTSHAADRSDEASSRSDEAPSRSSQEAESSHPRHSDRGWEADLEVVPARLRRARARQDRLRDAYDLSCQDLELLGIQSLRSRQDGHESLGLLTTGLVVSEDGQTLWAGCQKGIFEFKLNMRQRMNFPSFETR